VLSNLESLFKQKSPHIHQDGQLAAKWDDEDNETVATDDNDAEEE